MLVAHKEFVNVPRKDLFLTLSEFASSGQFWGWGGGWIGWGGGEGKVVESRKGLDEKREDLGYSILLCVLKVALNASMVFNLLHQGHSGAQIQRLLHESGLCTHDIFHPDRGFSNHHHHHNLNYHHHSHYYTRTHQHHHFVNHHCSIN